MKKVLLLLPILLFFGCASLPRHIQLTASTNLLIFQENGLFVSTGYTTRNYKSISIVETWCIPGYMERKSLKQNNFNKSVGDDLYQEKISTGLNALNSVYVQCSIDDMLLDLINKAKSLGADGVLDLKINNSTGYVLSNGLSSPATTHITGLAVKFSDN